MTLGQYQALYAIQKTDMDELDKVSESVAVLTGKTHREVEGMGVMDFQKVVSELARIWEQVKLEAGKVSKTIHANGKIYGLTYIPAHLTAGQYIELQKWMQGDVFENAHLILASISYPIVNGKDGVNDSSIHAQVAEDFQEAAFKDIYASMLFFCQLFDSSIGGLENYLAKVIRRKMIPWSQRKAMLTRLRETMDGFTQLNRSQTITTSTSTNVSD